MQNIVDRLIGNILQKSNINKGFAVDSCGIEIWNRDGDTVLNKAFSEYPNSEGNYVYSFTTSGTKFNPGDLENGIVNSTRVEMCSPVCGLEEFFSQGVNILELGCGGGQAAIDIFKRYKNKKIKYLAVDYEIGKRIAKPFSLEINLRFEQMDWRNLNLADSSVDRILSVQGVARYGSRKAAEEVTRVAVQGAIFRGDMDRGVAGRADFSDHLCELGWNVWVNKLLIVAVKR